MGESDLNYYKSDAVKYRTRILFLIRYRVVRLMIFNPTSYRAALHDLKDCQRSTAASG